jgi:hypothetical protein
METTGQSAQPHPALHSITAAHGITARVAATWFPALVRTPRLLVPIELDVLMVHDTTLSWAATAMTPPPKADHATGAPPTSAATLLPPPFTDLAAPRPRGAYLHWYLPNGLTNATVGEPANRQTDKKTITGKNLRSGTSHEATNTITFPPIPDRWLVLRISPGRFMHRRAVRGWVLESGSEPPQVFDLDGWIESGAAPEVEKPLTALGHGDLTWAGYFDNVINRLGFYDGTLERDEIQGPIAYVVCGWYADPTQDPLGHQEITTLAQFYAKMRLLGWTFETHELDEVTKRARDYVAAAHSLGLLSTVHHRLAATTAQSPHVTPHAIHGAPHAIEGAWWPSSCLFHGAVVGIAWPGANDTREAAGPPDPASITVAVGNTMAETMGSLVGHANATPDHAAIVEALQLGVLKELDEPDGRAQLDLKLHASSFASHLGGPPATEPLNIAPSGPPKSPPSSPKSPSPGIFAQSGNAPAPSHPHPMHVRPAPEAGELTVAVGHARTVHAEENIVRGSLNEIIEHLGAGVKHWARHPGKHVDALRAMPRLFTPKDPIVLMQGGKRAFVHDSSVPTEDGLVVCRLAPIKELSWQMPTIAVRPSVHGADILEHGVENGSVPLECEGILEETALFDTGSASAIAATAAARAAAIPGHPALDRSVAERNVAVEQTVWYSLRNPRIDHGSLITLSGFAGTLPAARAVAPASRPWTPMHLEWSVEFVPSPNGVRDWDLDQIDFVCPETVVPPAGAGLIFSGRSAVTGGASKALASAVNNALHQAASIAGTGQVPAGGREAFYSEHAQRLLARFQRLGIATDPSPGSGTSPTQLEDLATALSHMDVLSCGLDGLLTQLRGGVLSDGQSTAAGGTVPTPFYAIRAGFLRLVRLRLVDGFGQFVDLCGSDATHNAHGYLVSAPLSIPQQPDVLALPPRFSAPTRAWFRFMSADMPEKEADHETSPVCAFVLPNHLDGSLEFFNADGSGAGSLQPLGDGRVIWQDEPGRSTVAGQSPGDTLTNTYAVQLAQSLINWGIADASQDREPALSALLRTIDSTLWSVDPFGHVGDEHLSLLLGHPICVLRALVRLDVIDPVVTPDGTLTAVPIRLGDLTLWQDGLLGYFVNDDYTVLHVADAAAPGMARQVGPHQGFLQQINLVRGHHDSFADDLLSGSTNGSTPVTHPYVDTSGVFWIRPNQTVNLTLLVEPLTSVHATLGLVPRKQIGMRRSWVQTGLAAIAPTFRFGPVLVDPQHIRMPLPADLNGTWVWDYRSDAAKWNEDPTTNATDAALLSIDPATAIEGWLKLKPPQTGRSRGL